ncbi:1D-myo-inositol 2-acetamido-2-deoxy-alpha-D-glucopyranoside deacetylase [Mycolicibacterium insubricum]|uniref:1D-myo-inositol 2-acetamido-2-deoxy-alpha-D-glucopyranoside deacetylase n=1 Tax=Mycolicibacterium insubricum TaxID=444597 RepID=A0A1X0DMR2_9MYCO|nr:N-acetyl-1-D-myo-inositol-2-amino-2-deoxy-alpha-D-glucopyranoside deacetylase [Mycolicibacterium insubricum]MCV7081621.1 N-acetyl-1-D-myo-inositol-2-amino-2-deoxy-alpha-D-glucopyranoside deacetylase [Mycolicibacterium insubricum]ORA73617.1 N-acetyl-1-D-myo-inositol-2-amino-2-deoxy-alpha-D-glucopyranoside deacetylase [Mycolicibacterium insubricum]BBZ68346.1 1D-myo-inositol 2-acetamido-2-deoxy-alpha-D-glucopyranoside deacetylase [Mycolicibacterium insubricum]
MPAETARLLFVHAHPDDETINNGATIAHYRAAGAQVTVLTCTLGEEGEVIGDRWAHLVADEADQLGGYRIGELTAALNALGVDEPMFLGGAGRWRDSGMAGTPPRGGRTRFVDADESAAVGELVAVLRRLRPHVVVTYDPNGGYGHPDHIQAHRITTAAVAAAAASGGDGEPWVVPKFYWTVAPRSAWTQALAELGPDDLNEGWFVPDDPGFGYPDDQVTTAVDAADGLAAKAQALRCHATQVVVGPTGRACALSNALALPISGVEHYRWVSGSVAPAAGAAWESCLLAGLEL